jgi:GTPase SAR1 family protein
MKTILVIGQCGVGKTWVLKSLLKDGGDKALKLKKFNFHENDKFIVVGKYDGSTFEGSDKLSMSIMTDLDIMLTYIKKTNKIAVFEGDRFTNSNFIAKANPFIIKILGDGELGRKQRGSNQSIRQLKSISTRVRNIKADEICNDSAECLQIIKKYI